MRIGIGYDIHKLTKNRDLILGGVKIPYEIGLLGHSDADVLIHAIIDAMLGALALGDIGKHFPDCDPQYRGINSMDLLLKVKELIKEYKIINIDSNIICQKPKLANYIDLMRQNISVALGLNINQISIKAKTNEQLDSIGQNRAISANTVIMLDELKSSY